MVEVSASCCASSFPRAWGLAWGPPSADPLEVAWAEHFPELVEGIYADCYTVRAGKDITLFVHSTLPWTADYQRR